MSDRQAEERIAQLQARALAQRLAAQLAILEAREQLAPLRSAYGVVAAAGRLLSPQPSARGVIGALARFGLGHPVLTSTLAAASLRVATRRPLAIALATVIGAAAWWHLQRPSGPGEREDRDE
jgi:hypothetical protein